MPARGAANDSSSCACRRKPCPACPAPLALKPSGPPRTVAAEAEPMEAAFVTDVRMVEGADGTKIFSTAGGDPAINGLYTYLALFYCSGRLNRRLPDWRLQFVGRGQGNRRARDPEG